MVSAHAGHVAHVVAHVVGDGSGVTGVIFGDTGFDLTNQVSAHVSSLGVDAAAHTGKQCHEGSAHAVHDHDVAQLNGILDAEHEVQQGEPDGDIQHTQADDGEAHDGTGGEGDTQALVQAFRSGLSGTSVGIGGDLHAHQTCQHRPDATGQEGEGGELREHLAAACESDDDEQDEDHDKDLCHGGVLTLQIGVCTLTDVSGDLLHLFGTFGKAHNLLCLKQGKDDSQSESQEPNPEKAIQD